MGGCGRPWSRYPFFSVIHISVQRCGFYTDMDVSNGDFVGEVAFDDVCFKSSCQYNKLTLSHEPPVSEGLTFEEALDLADLAP